MGTRMVKHKWNIFVRKVGFHCLVVHIAPKSAPPPPVAPPPPPPRPLPVLPVMLKPPPPPPRSLPVLPVSQPHIQLDIYPPARQSPAPKITEIRVDDGSDPGDPYTPDVDDDDWEITQFDDDHDWHTVVVDVK